MQPASGAPGTHKNRGNRASAFFARLSDWGGGQVFREGSLHERVPFSGASCHAARLSLFRRFRYAAFLASEYDSGAFSGMSVYFSLSLSRAFSQPPASCLFLNMIKVKSHSKSIQRTKKYVQFVQITCIFCKKGESGDASGKNESETGRRTAGQGCRGSWKSRWREQQ